ncbi:NAD(P)-binding domain-containing protein [Nocardia sp. 348MFTsu5.1]|uniref:NAD(P)-binding domain-containing protein n=1 Tax=Nocardia sp. 348MFTsu5.1 TaxID=1172185 RepID=UPI00350FBC4D
MVGAGSIGKTLSHRLSAAGHDVKVANSRGPETIDAHALSSGATAVPVTEVVKVVDVVILSIPLNRIPGVATLFSSLPTASPRRAHDTTSS